jgi:hypothetical protein
MNHANCIHCSKLIFETDINFCYCLLERESFQFGNFSGVSTCGDGTLVLTISNIVIHDGKLTPQASV